MVVALEARKKEDLTPSLVKSMLISEYRKREGKNSVQSTESAMKTNSYKPTEKCFFCQRKGHLKHECLKYRKWKSNQKSKKEDRATAAAEVSSDSEYDGYTTDHNLAYCANENNCMEDVSWYLDSAATSRMTSDIDFFIDKLDSNYRSSVRVANQYPSPVYGIGCGKIKCLTVSGQPSFLEFGKVLFVPEFSSRLISITVLDEQGYCIKIENGTMIISKKNVEIAVCDMHRGMYKLGKTKLNTPITHHQDTLPYAYTFGMNVLVTEIQKRLKSSWTCFWHKNSVM